MGYEGMKVAELRALAEERGVAVGKGARKADVVRALEEADAGVRPVEAEVVEEEPGGIAVSLLPGTLCADFAALDARIDAVLEPYEGWEPSAATEDELRQVARERRYLNGVARELDERRKEVKREYLRPLAELEGMVNERRDRIKAVAGRLKAVEDEADAARRAAKEAELREHYEAVAGLLADVVPYERVADPKWLNKSPHVEECKRELEDRCRKAASDWEALKGLSLEYADEAELRFFQTLDLGDATAYASKLAEDKRRLEAMKAERAVYVPAPEPLHAEEPQAPAEPLPAPGARMEEARLLAAAKAYEPWQVEKLADALEVAKREPKNLPQPRVMVMESATVEQLQAIGGICGLMGVTGVMKTGTLAQVAARTA